MRPRPAARCCGVLLALLGATGAGASPPFEQPRSLGFLQQRGGIQVGTPYRKGNAWLLPVVCNVSGITRISTTPTIIHAGLAWSRTMATLEEGRIVITVLTAQQGTQAPSAQCGPARLRHYRGEYSGVWYRDPDGAEHHLPTVDTGLH